MLRQLTGLRFIAMLMVFTSHLNFMSNSSITNEFYNKYLSFGGSAGVSFFLVLSGFIMSYNYLDKFECKNIKYSKEFIIKRVSKIYPLHILVLIISIPLCTEIFQNIFNGIIKLIINMLLLQSLIPFKGVYTAFNGASWTLSCLFIFYIVTPLLLESVNSINKKCGIKGLYLFGSIIFFIAAIIIIVFYKRNNNISTWFFYFSPFFRIIDYLLGIILGTVFKYNINIKSNFSVYEYIVVFLYLITVFFNKNISIGFSLGLYWIPISMLIIYVFALGRGKISKLLSNSIFDYLGKISFSFYLLHYPIIRYIVYFVELYNIEWNCIKIIMMAVVSFSISILFSIISFRYIEEPLRKKILDLFIENN